MKRFLIFLSVFSVLNVLNADTTTSRLGLTKPDQSSTGWGTKLNANYDTLDAGIACLGCTNVFTGANTFASIAVKSSNPLTLYNFNNTAAGLLSNPGDSGQSQLIITALDDMAINSSPISGVSFLVYGDNINGLNRGSFAVAGSSADATVAYSGFIGTGPITTSTLWSLPRADGTANQPIVTDGSAHLSFGTTIAISTLTATGYVQFGSKTLAQLKALTPSAVGQTYFCSNCTTDALVVSTATTIGGFGRVSARTTTIQ